MTMRSRSDVDKLLWVSEFKATILKDAKTADAKVVHAIIDGIAILKSVSCKTTRDEFDKKFSVFANLVKEKVIKFNLPKELVEEFDDDYMVECINTIVNEFKRAQDDFSGDVWQLYQSVDAERKMPLKTYAEKFEKMNHHTEKGEKATSEVKLETPIPLQLVPASAVTVMATSTPDSSSLACVFTLPIGECTPIPSRNFQEIDRTKKQDSAVGKNCGLKFELDSWDDNISWDDSSSSELEISIDRVLRQRKDSSGEHGSEFESDASGSSGKKGNSSSDYDSTTFENEDSGSFKSKLCRKGGMAAIPE